MKEGKGGRVKLHNIFAFGMNVGLDVVSQCSEVFAGQEIFK